MPGAVKSISVAGGLVTALGGGLIATVDMTPGQAGVYTVDGQVFTFDASGRLIGAGGGTLPCPPPPPPPDRHHQAHRRRQCCRCPLRLTPTRPRSAGQ